MWISKRGRELPVGEAAAELGAVTLGGDPAGVNLGGERRRLPVYGPGGYCWRPAVGEKVLVLKTGAGEESPCVVGAPQKKTALAPGEVCLTGGSCSILLGQTELALRGAVTVNGQTLENCIKAIVAELLEQGG